MYPGTERRITDAITFHNLGADYKRFSLQQIRDRVALVSQDRELGGFDVKVCEDDEFLEGALERAFRSESKVPLMGKIEEVFYSLAVERWHARLFDNEDN